MKRPALSAWVVATGLVVVTGVALAGGLAIWAADPFTTPPHGAGASPTSATATIVRSDLVSQIDLSATLGYAGTYTIGYPAANSTSQSPIETGTTTTNTTADPAAAPSSSPTASSQPSCSSHPAATSATMKTTTVPSTTTTTTTTVPPATGTTSTTSTTTSTTSTTSTTTVPARRGRRLSPSTSCSGHRSGNDSPTPLLSSGHRPSGHGTPSSGSPGPSSGGGRTPTVVTALPRVGQVIIQGQALFAVNGTPSVLLHGSTPPWRTLIQGTTGPDVAELNVDLVALGDTTAAQLGSARDTYGAATTAAVKKLQANLGTTRTGTLSLGQAAFEPNPIRVTNVSATPGGPVPAGGPILTATSTTRLITATIEASQRSEFRAGDAVTIARADGITTPGKVTSIGTDATEPSGNGPFGSTAPPPTVAVTITPTDPVATGKVDQAPVLVAVTIAGVHNALAVPAAALVTTSGGHPAIDVLDAAGTTRSLPVTLGILDDANGLIQISGPGISAGETISLPAQLTTRT